MEEFSLIQVTKLFENLVAKPMSRIFVRFAQENPEAVNLEKIKEKLDQKLYASPFDFALDVRDLIGSAQKFYTGNKNAILVLEDLSFYFESQIGSLPLTKKEEINQRLQTCLSKYTKVRRAMAMSAFAPTVTKTIPVKTAISKSVHGPPAPLIQEIQRLLNEVTDVETLAEICRILKTHIPDFELQENLVIDAKNLSAKCIEDLRRALTRNKENVE